MTAARNNIFFQSLLKKKHALVALTGAGGKTSLMHWIACHAQSQQKTALLTTTTKLFPVSTVPIITAPQKKGLASIKKRLQKERIILLAKTKEQETGKLTGLTKDYLDCLHHSAMADILLAEADGAKGKPLKAPNATEPVIPQTTTVCIAVAGLDALGKPLAEQTVHRHTLFAQRTGLLPGQPITIHHILQIATHQQGLFKTAPPDCKRILFLNKKDLLAAPLWQELKKTIQEYTRHTPLTCFLGSVHQRQVCQITQ